MKKHFAIITLALLVALSFTSCDKLQKKTDTATVASPAEEEVVLTAVSITPVSTGHITNYHAFGGNVEAKDTLQILPEASGKILELMIEEGDTVSKDQIVATIDPSRPGQNFKSSPVKAHMNGTVTFLNSVIGQTVSPASSLGTIATLDDLEINFNVIERYVAQVKLGQKATIKFDAFPGEEFPATITKLSPTIDMTTRTRTATLTLDKTDDRVVAGMYARINLITEAKDGVIVVPYTSITINDSGAYAFVADESKTPAVAKKVVVTTGIRESSRVEITSGLSIGDKLITKGQGLVSDGTTITIIK